MRTVSFVQHKQHADIDLQITELNFKPDINQWLQKKYVVSDVVAREPSVRYTRENSFENADGVKRTGGFPLIAINSLVLVNPSIVMDIKGDKRAHLDLRGNEFGLKDIRSSSKRIDAGTITSRIRSLQYVTSEGVNIESGKGEIEANINAAHFNIEKDTSQSRWQAMIALIALSDIQFDKTKIGSG